MRVNRSSRLAPILGAATLAALPLGVAVVPAQGGPAVTRQITPSGVGGITLGASYRKLRAQRLVGAIRLGCIAGGPNTRAAPLRAPLGGGVDFTLTSPRKATNISITQGASARGVGIGAGLTDVKAAYPRAQVDHTPEMMFGFTLVKIPKGGGGKLQFAIDTKTKKVKLIGVPLIPICE